jgi:hypothetical protein
MPHTPYHEMRERYQQHAVSMGDSMREVRALLEASAASDLEPNQLLSEIDHMINTLTNARYHADRMKVLDNLMRGGLRDANREGHTHGQSVRLCYLEHPTRD